MSDATAAAPEAPASATVPSAGALSREMLKKVDAAKLNFATHMDHELLDYKHNHPQVIEACINMLYKIFTNILEHPEELKFRQVKSTSNAFKAVVNARGGEHLMTLAGFGIKVVDCQKYWVFESDSYGLKDRILFECTAILQRSLATVHAKAERKRNEKEAAELFEQQRREAVRMAMLDDRLERKVREEALAAAAAAHAAVPASALPSRTPAAVVGSGPPDADADEGEDE